MRQPENDAPTRGVAILGSTGSIGTQALDVLRDQRDALHVEVLSAHRNADLLIAQAKEFKPNVVVIGDEDTPIGCHRNSSPVIFRIWMSC